MMYGTSYTRPLEGDLTRAARWTYTVMYGARYTRPLEGDLTRAARCTYTVIDVYKMGASMQGAVMYRRIVWAKRPGSEFIRFQIGLSSKRTFRKIRWAQNGVGSKRFWADSGAHQVIFIRLE